MVFIFIKKIHFIKLDCLANHELPSGESFFIIAKPILIGLSFLFYCPFWSKFNFRKAIRVLNVKLGNKPNWFYFCYSKILFNNTKYSCTLLAVKINNIYKSLRSTMHGLFWKNSKFFFQYFYVTLNGKSLK